MKKLACLLACLLAPMLACGQSYTKFASFCLLKGCSSEGLPIWGAHDRYLYAKFPEGWRKYDLKKAFVKGNLPQDAAPDMDFKGYETVQNPPPDTAKALYEVKTKKGREIILQRGEMEGYIWAERRQDQLFLLKTLWGWICPLVLSSSGKFIACKVAYGGDAGIWIFNVERCTKDLKTRPILPAKRFDKSTKKAVAKRLIGKWSSKSADLFLAKDAADCFENLFQEGDYDYIQKPAKGAFSVHFLPDGTYRIAAGKETRAGKWQITNGEIILQEMQTFGRHRLEFDWVRNTPRLLLLPTAGKPYVAAYRLERE